MDIQKNRPKELKLFRRWPESDLVVFLPPFRFNFQINGPISSRGRRTILTMVFKKLRELFGEIERAEIYHRRKSKLYGLFPPPAISLREAPVLDTSLGRAGYALRLRRHENRLTLRELSDLSGVNLGHISDIERGKHRPTSATIQKIESALARYEDEGVICLSGIPTRRPKDFRKSGGTGANDLGPHGPVPARPSPEQGDVESEQHVGPSRLDGWAAMAQAQQDLAVALGQEHRSAIDSDPPKQA